MATKLLVPGDICCTYENRCNDRNFQNCSRCKNNEKNINRTVKESFLELIKERR